MSRSALLLVSIAALGCARVPNPNYLDEAGSETGPDETGSETAGETAGDGDGDASGDGDGEASGDGDGAPTGDGDGDVSGDGDGDCVEGELGCACEFPAVCDDGLACVVGTCVQASSCAPVDDAVIVSAAIQWVPSEPPVMPIGVQTAICAVAVQQQGPKAIVSVSQCASPTLAALTLELQPALEPLASLVGEVGLAANVRVLVDAAGTYVRVDVDGMDLYYIAATSLFAEGLTEYPWVIAPFSSSCGVTPVGCGTSERLALFVDGGVVFDGTAAEVSPAATVWAETVLDTCEQLELELALLGH